jgi:hypothetical protein
MKKIIVTHYESPDKTSLRTADRKYRVLTDFQNHKFEFDTKKEVEDFLRKFSQDLTDLLFLYNESYARAFMAYRVLWFYMDDVEQNEVDINHKCDVLVVSISRLFDRITHWDNGGDAFKLTKDIRGIGNELKQLWLFLVKVAMHRSQWADNYRFRLEVSMVDNFRERLESIIKQESEKPEPITYVEMLNAKEMLDHPVNLDSKFERQKFASSLTRLRKHNKKEIINHCCPVKI